MSQSDRHKFVKAPENLAIRPARPSGRSAGRPTGEFLWVDYKENQSKARDLVRSKQAFVRTRHHRLRREKQAQHTGSLPQCPSHPVASSSHSKSDSDEDDHPRVELTPSPQAGVTDGSPSLAVSTHHNPNIYFHHCEYSPQFLFRHDVMFYFLSMGSNTSSIDRIHSSRACFPLCSKDVTVWFWKKAVEDPTLMQIKLAISASHRAAILAASGAPSLAVQKPAQDALRFRGETIKSLRYILQNTSTMCYEQTVFIIAHIIVSEVCTCTPYPRASSVISMHLLTQNDTGLGGQCRCCKYAYGCCETDDRRRGRYGSSWSWNALHALQVRPPFCGATDLC